MSKSAKVLVTGVAAKMAVGSAVATVSHKEAATRISKLAAKVTTKQDAQAFLRSAGILNRKNKLVKALG